MELSPDDSFLRLAPGSCPCCGVMNSCYGGCTVCGWEDSVPRDQIDEHFSNTHTLREAQHFFLRFGCCGANPWLWAGTAENFDPQTPRDPNWRLLPPPFNGTPVADPLQPLIGANCPCCGYKTINAGFQVCDICVWMYCPEQEYPDKEGRYNGVSLREAQGFFAEWGAKQPAFRPYVRAPLPSDVRDPLWRPVRDPINQRLPELSDRTCPVCGYKASKLGGEFCSICAWPYFRGHRDGYDPSQPNTITISMAQKSFRQFGAWKNHPLLLSYVRAPLPSDVRDPDWEPAA